MCSPVCTHTYMCFCLNGPLWFSHGYLLVISQQQKFKAPSSPTSLSTVVYISFPCLYVALNCPREERDLLCDPSVATDAVEMLKWWGIRACGFICQSFSLHLRQFVRNYPFFVINDAKNY